MINAHQHVPITHVGISTGWRKTSQKCVNSRPEHRGRAKHLLFGFNGTVTRIVAHTVGSNDRRGLLHTTPLETNNRSTREHAGGGTVPNSKSGLQHCWRPLFLGPGKLKLFRHERRNTSRQKTADAAAVAKKARKRDNISWRPFIHPGAKCCFRSAPAPAHRSLPPTHPPTSS